MTMDGEGFGDRLNALCRTVGSKKRAAAAMGVSEDMVYRYIKGDTKPPLQPIAELCAVTGASLDWLAFGGAVDHDASGGAEIIPLRPIADHPAPVAATSGGGEEDVLDRAPDPAILSDAVKLVEEELSQRGVPFSIEQKGRAIALIYQFLLLGADEPSRDRFARDLLRSL